MCKDRCAEKFEYERRIIELQQEVAYVREENRLIKNQMNILKGNKSKLLGLLKDYRSKLWKVHNEG